MTPSSVVVSSPHHGEPAQPGSRVWTSGWTVAATVGINFSAGTAATVVGGGVENLVNTYVVGTGPTYEFSPEQALVAGAANALVSGIADSVISMHGVNTMAQYAEFAPGATAFAQASYNAEALMQNAAIQGVATITAGMAASQSSFGGAGDIYLTA
jgi:hypothetical protein